MLAAKAPHPNCAYMWMRYISTPKVQAEQAVNYGETPDNKLACPIMNQLQAGSCEEYHANAPSQLPRLDRAVEDPDRHLRQRPAGLCALLRVGIRLEYPGQVTDGR